MLKTLYRYPHPFKADTWLYVGQGPKRDQPHRSGKSSFGRRFQKLFPGVELPQPVRETIDVADAITLNEEETIWIFRFHTWRGYPDGMNLRFPGDKEYLNLSLYRRAQTPEERRAQTKKSMQTMGPEGLRARAKTRVANMGHEALSTRSKKFWAARGPEVRTASAKKGKATMGPEACSAAVKKANETTGPERRHIAGKKRGHTRWHVRRGRVNLNCEFCVIQQSQEKKEKS